MPSYLLLRHIWSRETNANTTRSRADLQLASIRGYEERKNEKKRNPTGI